PPSAYRSFVQDKYSENSEVQLRRLVSLALNQKIVASRSVLPSEDSRGLIINEIRKPAPDNELALSGFKEIKTVEEVQEQLPVLSEQLRDPEKDGVSFAALIPIAGQLIFPNMTFNSVETDLRRARAVTNVPNVILKVQAGEAIIRSGDRYEPYHMTILQGIRKQKAETSFLIKLFGTTLFVSILLLVTYIFSKKFIRKFHPTREDLYFLGGVLILLLLSVRLAATFSWALVDLIPFDVSVLAFYYAIPVAGGAMLVRHILNSEISLIFAIVASALSGIFLEADLDLSIYYLISGIVAAAAIAHVDRRSSILKAGVITGVINSLVVLAIKLISAVSVTSVLNLTQVSFGALMGFLGGVFASIFVMVMAPIAEMVFNYVTDIKLLELGNLNHPLLREMIVKAPGTYHHSQLVAVLSEAAAADIGANPLLARVGSYFHDIGKMRKPDYFIENQQGGVNRHDKLSPSMSALIIAAHVKDGVEMAREYKLPQRITDFIPQHQGTKVITYFYKKALEQSDGKEPVEEKNYRYPGPRPQTREAGIILLADGAEASVRSLPEKTPQRIKGQVQKIINSNFIEEQLDECDMTLRDLHKIAETFTRVLVGIYHQRIAYPDDEEKKATVTPIKNVAKSK
ncbi:MAG: HDIG domain-containing protein, partial [bacterium]|nr:HDIG domain-containing protein [bacterium]